ncbi:MAG: DUF6265 family protein [Planctomycetota bacterium]|nr:DUF6265 family protein [Planctomycetota bacterium]
MRGPHACSGTVLAALGLLAGLGACGVTPSVEEVRTRDLGFLTGRWTGANGAGEVLELVFSEPADGAIQGQFEIRKGGETIVESRMRMIAGVRGVVLIGSLDGEPRRSYALVDFGRGEARFASAEIRFPADIRFERSGSHLTMTVRGETGLRQVQTDVYELRQV